MSDFLLTQEQATPLSILEITRHLSPSGSRVDFVQACEEQGIRRYLQEFPDLWHRVTDMPPREGITPDEQFLVAGRIRGTESLHLQCQAIRCLEAAGIRTVAFQGPSLALQLYGEPAGGHLEEVDLFVDPSQAAEAARLLEGLGFQAGSLHAATPRQRADFFRYGGAEGFYQVGGSQHLLLYWRLFPSWVGPDLLPFEEVYKDSVQMEYNGCVWRAMGPEHTLVTQALLTYAFGFSRLHRLVDFGLCLERLDYSWEKALKSAGYRAVLVERVAEMCSKMLRIHQVPEAHYYSDRRQIVAEWRRFFGLGHLPTRELLEPKYWSCHASQALVYKLRALTWPRWSDVLKFSLPPALRGLYRLVSGVRALLGQRDF